MASIHCKVKIEDIVDIIPFSPDIDLDIDGIPECPFTKGESPTDRSMAESEVMVRFPTESTSSSESDSDSDVDLISPITRQETTHGTVVKTRKGGMIMPSGHGGGARKERKLKRRPRLDRIPDGIHFTDGEGSQKHPLLACYVNGPFITFSRSDGKPNLIPPTFDLPPSISSTGDVNYFTELPRDHHAFIHWQRRIGNFIARKLLHAPDAKTRNYYITNFPEHYVLVQQRKGDRADPRTDTYLYGSGRVTRFRSPREFYPHVMWLLEKQGTSRERKNCACEYCHEKRETLRRREKRGVRKVLGHLPVPEHC